MIIIIIIIVRVAHWHTKPEKKTQKHRLLTYNNRTDDDLFVLCNIRLRLWGAA